MGLDEFAIWNVGSIRLISMILPRLKIMSRSGKTITQTFVINHMIG
jgi:hypothetical protein